MIVVNTETIAGYQIIQVKGIVQGNTVRSKHAGRDIAAGLKNLFGGEIRSYHSLMVRARRETLRKMLEQAQLRGYNAI